MISAANVREGDRDSFNEQIEFIVGEKHQAAPEIFFEPKQNRMDTGLLKLTYFALLAKDKVVLSG